MHNVAGRPKNREPEGASMRWIIFLLLAGCAGTSTNEEPVLAPEPSSETEDLSVAEEVEPVSWPLNWEGSLERGFWICDWNQTNECVYAPDEGVYDQVTEISLPVGNVTGVIELAWEPKSQVTQQLAFGYRIYTPGCDVCAVRSSETFGASPLEHDLTGPVDAGAVLRMWAYGYMLDELHEGVYYGLSDEQPFDVQGVLQVA